MAADHDEFGYLVDIVDSVIENGREGALCATTSMHRVGTPRSVIDSTANAPVSASVPTLTQPVFAPTS